ncbi:hypothetical protein QLT00_gp74 [Gordonia phage Commandaria]|uniref:Uncharacterized protein n=1 Tax=Gordonia phage Commandaria TaxID=3038364 RepID=A0AAF0K083_9CAUD|nr:hypothetical protein QLT00_gp74 [Gordonia phage Commandaria]WGH20857.1 hypothetical protein [Gordonia phage Commandaria]
MQEFLVEVDQSTTTTFAVQAESEAQALDRFREFGVPQHSESHVSEPRIVRSEATN